MRLYYVKGNNYLIIQSFFCFILTFTCINTNCFYLDSKSCLNRAHFQSDTNFNCNNFSYL